MQSYIDHMIENLLKKAVFDPSQISRTLNLMNDQNHLKRTEECKVILII